ncbi:unnamed protein product [Didymodactylos carnosus]|uniref:Uncharacterized protein n=1 Tax=Didymodactylos carnosus TaxID=1234261 RepID=A0A814YKI3_9BILA|nr:unnamed protein product [Didymodactylos carnosus]CAF3993538.1 unnamed protein product [Didymodactylos carnosus]
MTVSQPNLIEGLSLLAWRLQRDDELESRKSTTNFYCELETTPTSYAAYQYPSADDYCNPKAVEVDLCCEVDEEDYDPYEVFLRINTRRTSGGQRTSLTSHTSTGSGNFRNYNYADDDTPVKYPFAIGYVDRRTKTNSTAKYTYKNRGGQSYEDDLSVLNDDYKRPYLPIRNDNTVRSGPQFSQGVSRPSSVRGPYRGFRGGRSGRPAGHSRNEYHSKRVTFADYSDEEDEDEESLDVPLTRRKPTMRSSALTAVQRFRAMKNENAYDEDDEDIAPTVQEMDMLDYDDLDRPTQRKTNNETKQMDEKYKTNPKSSSYIGNMLPSFYDQLSESKKMLLQDATIDSSSAALTSQTTTKLNEKTSTDEATKADEQITETNKQPSEKTVSEEITNEGSTNSQRNPRNESVFITEQVEGPGGEEIIEEETRVQFKTRPTKGNVSKINQGNDESMTALDNSQYSQQTTTSNQYRNERQREEDFDEPHRGRYYNEDKRVNRDIHRQRSNRFRTEQDDDEIYSSQYRRGTGVSPSSVRQRYDDQNNMRRRPYINDDTGDYPLNKRSRPTEGNYYSQSQQQQQVKNSYSISPPDDRRQRYGQVQRPRPHLAQHDYDDNDEEDLTMHGRMKQGKILAKGPYGKQTYRESSYDREYTKRNDRILQEFEEQYGLKMGEMRVFTPKLRLRISNVNVNWINIPPVPKLPNKVRYTQSTSDNF